MALVDSKLSNEFDCVNQTVLGLFEFAVYVSSAAVESENEIAIRRVAGLAYVCPAKISNS